MPYYEDSKIGCVAALVFVVIILLVALLPGILMSDARARAALESDGYVDVVITGKTIFAPLGGCGNDDVAKFTFEGTNERGTRVTDAYVCVGWPFKGTTVRYP